MLPRLLSLLLLLAIAVAVPARAQVTIERDGSYIRIQTAGYEHQTFVRDADAAFGANVLAIRGLATTSSVLEDSTSSGGNATGGDGEIGDETVILIGGYQDADSTGGDATGGSATGGDGEIGDETVILIGGYQEVLDYLRTAYGAEIERDDVLGVDVVRLAGFEDPLLAFVEIIQRDSLDGRPLVDYLRMMEVVNIGRFGETIFPPLPSTQPSLFPRDEHFNADWGYTATGFVRAHWLPARAQRRVTVGLIDAGVRASQRSHPGLDGMDVEHVDFAPSADLQVPHGLAVATLFADAANDGTGSAGLLGAWENVGCLGEASYFARARPALRSYNVGDWGPSSLYVARAIRASVEAGADVLNLSFRLDYSPTVADAVQAALDAGVVVVAAAGNYAPDAAAKPTSFPASIDGVIAVGAAEPARRGVALAAFSANEGLDILAPGSGVVLGGPDGIWYSGAGTSYAAAYVTAAAAMMKAADGGLTSADVLRALRRGGAQGVGGVPFLDAHTSLLYALPSHAYGLRGKLGAVIGCRLGDVAGFDTFAGKNGLIADDAAPEAQVPVRFALAQNYPNPFNPTTQVRFDLPEAAHVTLTVYDVLGREVARLVEGFVEAGSHAATFDGSGLANGTYHYRLVAGGAVAERTMVLMK